MKAFIGLLVFTLSTTAFAGEVPCNFLNAKGEVIGHVITKADSEAAAQIFAAGSDLVVLDERLYVREGFDLGLALKGDLEPVKKIDCRYDSKLDAQ